MTTLTFKIKVEFLMIKSRCKKKLQKFTCEFLQETKFLVIKKVDLYFKKNSILRYLFLHVKLDCNS